MKILRRDYAGFNITIPHKEPAVDYLDEVFPVMQELGAVNTVVISDSRMIGHNTDVPGFRSALSTLGPPFDTAVVLGSGGSARAAVAALRDQSDRIVVISRRPEAAARIRQLGGEDCTVLAAGSAEAREVVEGAHLLVNATPLGMP